MKKDRAETSTPRKTHNPFYAHIMGDTHNVVLERPTREEIFLNLGRWFAANHSFILATEHSDYADWKDAMLPNDGGVCHLIEALLPDYRAMAVNERTADHFVPLLKQHVPFPDLTYFGFTSALKQMSNSWGAYLADLQYNVATWLSTHHPLILCVDHPAYDNFSERLSDQYAQVLDFLHAIRHPYQDLDDASCTPETFTQIIHDLITEQEFEPLSQAFIKLLLQTERLWQKVEAQQRQEEAYTSAKRDAPDTLEAITQHAMAAPLAAVADQPHHARPVKRLRFFAEPQQAQEQELQNPQDTEFKAPYPVVKN